MFFVLRNLRCFFLWICCCMFTDLTKTYTAVLFMFFIIRAFLAIFEKYLWDDRCIVDRREWAQKIKLYKIVLYDCFLCSWSICQLLFLLLSHIYLLLNPVHFFLFLSLNLCFFCCFIKIYLRVCLRLLIKILIYLLCLRTKNKLFLCDWEYKLFNYLTICFLGFLRLLIQTAYLIIWIICEWNYQ